MIRKLCYDKTELQEKELKPNYLVTITIDSPFSDEIID